MKRHLKVAYNISYILLNELREALVRGSNQGSRSMDACTPGNGDAPYSGWLAEGHLRRCSVNNQLLLAFRLYVSSARKAASAYDAPLADTSPMAHIT